MAIDDAFAHLHRGEHRRQPPRNASWRQWIDVIHELRRFILDFSRSRAIIESYHNLTFAIGLCAKPNLVRTRPIYASSKVKIPSRQAAQIISIKTALPTGRDFIFESADAKFVVPAQMVDAGHNRINHQHNGPTEGHPGGGSYQPKC